CLGYCHTNAIAMGSDNVVHVDDDRCLGCGVCAYMCPEDAIHLMESKRIVRIAPPRKDAA
ncbi:MAG: 4Fe-4S binding protein, partial [Desulfobacterales bacterium]|nr:4Fe-4S binding protein [Desulfobacterales bacterium]